MKIFVTMKTVTYFNGSYNDDNNMLYDFQDFNIYVGVDEEKAKSFNLSDFDEDDQVEYLSLEVWENNEIIIRLIQEENSIWEIEEELNIGEDIHEL